jgi:F-type H+-transporting ATPase subunit gamma
MADTLTIRRRIKSVSSTRQITKAMQLVAASKLKAAAAAAAATRSYRRQLDAVLSRVALNPDWALHPLLQPSSSPVTHVVLIGSDHSLAGAYHVRLEAMLTRLVERQQGKGYQVELTTVGRIPAGIAARTSNVTVYERLGGLNVLPTIWEVHTAAARLMDRYQAGEIGRVMVIATRFESVLHQTVESRQLLPLTPPDITAPDGVPAVAGPGASAVPPTLEPEPAVAITAAIHNWLRAALLDAATSAVASEHAMRMLAMQNATTNAGDLIDDLTLEYNTARQAAITQELAEISGGVAALS